MTVLTLPRDHLSRFPHVENLYLDNAWIGDCHLYDAVLFVCILERLEMCHIRVFGPGIFGILDKWQFWSSFRFPCAFFTSKKISTWTVRRLEIFTYVMQSCFFASSREMWHSRVIVLGIFEILKRWQFWLSLKSRRVFLTREKISTRTVRGLQIVICIM